VKVLSALFQTIVLLSAAMSANLHTPIHGERNAPVAVGEVAPDFTLEDQNHNQLTLSNARGTPVVLVFYRGYW